MERYSAPNKRWNADLITSSEKTGLLVNSIREASSTNTSLPRLNKLDNSGYKFSGRSYGVASTVGLVPEPRFRFSTKVRIRRAWLPFLGHLHLQ